MSGIDRFRAKTGLPVATYFSASKLLWILQNVRRQVSSMFGHGISERRAQVVTCAVVRGRSCDGPVFCLWAAQVPGVREDALKGEAVFGTIDTWLVYNLTGTTDTWTPPSNLSLSGSSSHQHSCHLSLS